MKAHQTYKIVLGIDTVKTTIIEASKFIEGNHSSLLSDPVDAAAKTNPPNKVIMISKTKQMQSQIPISIIECQGERHKNP